MPTSEGRRGGVSSHLTATGEGALLEEWEWILNAWHSKCQPGSHLSAQDVTISRKFVAEIADTFLFK